MTSQTSSTRRPADARAASPKSFAASSSKASRVLRSLGRSRGLECSTIPRWSLRSGWTKRWRALGPMISIAIVDSGPLIAVANSADPAHRSCLEILKTPGLRLAIPALCVAEAAYLLHQRRGTAIEARFLRGLANFDVRAPLSEDW